MSAATNTSSNCSIAERAEIIDARHAVGVIADDTVGCVDLWERDCGGIAIKISDSYVKYSNI